MPTKVIQMTEVTTVTELKPGKVVNKPETVKTGRSFEGSDIPFHTSNTLCSLSLHTRLGRIYHTQS